MEQSHLCNFERRHYGEHSCESKWGCKDQEFGLVVQKEMSFKDISHLELWQRLCSVDGSICAIFEEGIMRNNPVKLF